MVRTMGRGSFRRALAHLAAVAWLAADGPRGPPPAPVDLLARTYFRSISLRPDGTRALSFEVDGLVAGELRLVDHRLTRAAGDAQLPVVLANAPLGQVEWSRDGRAAFVLRAPPQAEVWIAPEDEPPHLALFPDVSRGAFDLFWRARADGDELLVLHVVDGPGFRAARLSRADLATQELGETLLDLGRLTVEDGRLSPDGRTLALIATEQPNGAPEGEPLDLFVADLVTGALRRLTDGDGIAGRLAFSADSRYLHCGWWSGRTLLEPGKRDLLRFDLVSGLRRNLTREAPLSLGDGVLGFRERLCVDVHGRVTTATQHGLADHVVQIDPEARAGAPPEVRFVHDALESWQNLDVAENGTFLAVVSAPGRPERLVTGSTNDWIATSLSDRNAALAQRPLARAQRLEFELAGEVAGVLASGEALWLTPDAPAPWPTIVLLHGGSNGRATARFNDGYAEAFVAAGFAVCAPNLRGSAGYSQAFGEANRGDFGGRELDDLEALAGTLVERGLAEPRRLYLLGHSYGAFLASLALTRSDRFAAASATAGVSDWRRFESTSDLPQMARLGLGGPPDRVGARYDARSPLRQVASLQAPLLLFHGGRDRRVPLEQSLLLERALREAGRPCELVVEHGEGHVFRDRTAILRWIDGTIAWFHRHQR